MTTEYIEYKVIGMQRDLEDILPKTKNIKLDSKLLERLKVKAANLQSHIAYLKQHENYKG